MGVVYFPGCWDLLHFGHVAALREASKGGRRLIVGVASDAVVKEDKGELPIIGEWDRMNMVAALHCVISAHIYDQLEFLTHLKRFRPTHLAVSAATWGNQQRHKDAEAWCKVNGATVIRIPHYEGESTTAIKQRIIERGGKQS